MQRGYDPHRIEKKWQKIWEEKGFLAEDFSDKPKYYILDMFPYPSGAGLHVGHGVGYIATDILARYKRQKGFNVLHPMGWDSFGLPAEQYAIRTGTHPRITTEKNISTYKRQLRAFGLSYDWTREIATSDPKFYKWTQWIFTKLFERGLAYEAEMLVNYCPTLGTVLANEEVEDGLSKEGGYPVIRKAYRQWVLKITEYADRLLNDLDDLNWPESIKNLQRHWIGQNKGVKITFEALAIKEKIEVFTTRPETICGVSYLVLAPEHPLVDEVVTSEKKQEVKTYQEACAKKSDRARTDERERKTGVFTGAFASHPITNEDVPIWIADYVLGHYGTGAVMAVPGHDIRDFDFAQAYDLPTPRVIGSVEATKLPFVDDGICINSSHGDFSINGMGISEARETVAHWLETHKKGKNCVMYKLRDWLFSRQRYWGEPIPILHFEDGTTRALDLDELPLTPPELTDFKPKGGLSPLESATEWVEITDPKTGKKARRETNTMPQWGGSCWYYLRFLDPHNEETFCRKDFEKYWLPIDMYIGGAEHAVLHLLYARFWHKVLFDIGVVSTKEPFSRLFNQGMITHRSFKIKGGHYVSPDETEEKEGVFVHKKTGEVLESHVEKMSKSKLNVVNPDDVIEDFGADALRLYEMFLGPLDKDKIWNTDAVHGCKRFLNRFYELSSQEHFDEEKEEGYRLANRLASDVSEAIEKLHFNVAVAKLMEFCNDLSALGGYPKKAIEIAIQCLAPLAPHIAEELWEELGAKVSVFDTPFPIIDPKWLVDDQITLVVQVNGKKRGSLEVANNIDKESAIRLAKENPKVANYLEGEIVKEIFVPNRLINFVVRLPKT